MRILIVGAGALGGYFGAHLLAAGRDVTFLVRPGTAAQLAAHGLHVLSPAAGNLHLPPPPTILAGTTHPPFDLVLLSPKAQDLESSIDSLTGLTGPATLLLPMLNGMAHMPALDRRFTPANVLGGTCFISAVRDPDGTIRHLNHRDGLFFGERVPGSVARLPEVAAALLGAGFNAQLRPAILHDMWSKWSFIASLAGITCLLRANIGEIVAAGAAPLSLALYAECVAVATAASFPPTEAFRDEHIRYLTAPGSTLNASMLRDLEAGGPIEADQIVGDLLARARAFSLPTPVLEIADAHLRAYRQRLLRPTATV